MARPGKKNPNGEQIAPAWKEANESGKISKLILALQGGLNRETAISFAGLSKPSVYEWMKKYPNFNTQLDDAEEYWFAVVEDAKNKKVKAGYRPAIEKELKCKRPEVYGDRVGIDQKTTHVGTIKIELPS